MAWQPGQSGNPEGGRKNKPFRDALMIEMKAIEMGEETVAPVGSLRWNARQLLIKGDVQAIKEVADRLDGKVPQGLIGGDEGDNAIQIVNKIELVPVSVRPAD
jgi:hypothetical protein